MREKKSPKRIFRAPTGLLLPCSVKAEDLNETAVPATTDISGSIQGGRRFEQIGVSAAQKLLESVLHVDMPAKVTGVCIVDLTVGVGDTFWAWLERQGGIRKEASVFFFFRWG